MQSAMDIQSTLPAIPSLRVYHVFPTFCVKTLAEEGRLRVHDRNGTFVAFHGDMVFMTGINKDYKISRIKEGYKVVNKVSKVSDGCVSVEPVKQISTRFIHWLMLTKEDLNQLVERGMCT